MPGMMWAARASVDSAGMSRAHVCMDCTRSPFGRWVTMGVVAGCMLRAGALVVRKGLVVLESWMAQLRMVWTSVLIVLRRMAAANA
jgi:hypothetical protein